MECVLCFCAAHAAVIGPTFYQLATLSIELFLCRVLSQTFTQLSFGSPELVMFQAYMQT